MVCSAISRYKVSFPWVRAENLNICFRQAGSDQTGSHDFCSLCCVSYGIGRVDFDKFLINVACELIMGVILQECSEHQNRDKPGNHGSDFPPKSTSSGSSSTSVAASYGKCVESCSPISSMPRISPPVKSPLRNFSVTTSTIRCQNCWPTRS